MSRCVAYGKTDISLTSEQNNTVLVSITEHKQTGSLHGLVVSVPTSSSNTVDILITNSTYKGSSTAIDVQKIKDNILAQGTPDNSVIYLSLINVNIINKHLDYDTRAQPAISIIRADRILIQDCQFTNNMVTSAVEVYFSDVTFAGKIVFANNTGYKGGALALYHSYMLLTEGTNMTFSNNHAQEVGGAIYVQLFKKNDQEKPLCFYSIRHTVMDTVNVWFQNNSAVRGGDDVYGGRFRTICTYSREESKSSNDILQVFHLNNTSTLSSVTSDPTRVCFCDDKGMPQCTQFFKELPPLYPGELFTVSAVVVGNDFGTVPGIVYAEVLPKENNTSLITNQQTQEIQNQQECDSLKFSIESLFTITKFAIELKVKKTGEIIKNNVDLWVDLERYKTANTISNRLLYHLVYINITLEECPTGFNLRTNPPHICTCHPELENNGITTCVITNHTGWVYRSGTVWVSASFTENETNSFVVHQYCPYDYCKPDNISINLKLPDKQCAFNHSGILCGGCHGNLSLALGTSRCLQCNNNFVSLLIVFIIAGLILVFFIKVLDLTVAKGTINGLIFYANIVWANKSILFPPRETLHPVQQILHIFIAWLNLDLGIETCFIDGLDAFWKTCLQFVFPIYVWSITGLVIIASRRSIICGKIFGNNSVPVLATLILLSYAKLLRTIITSLGFSLLDYTSGTRMVWSLDGNVPYFGTAHTILFLVALAALLLLWLPYTIVLLTLQWLRRKSNLKPLRWINRWKPFFDAYFGQLKPKHHYWVGLLLLVRVLLLVLLAATSAIVPKLNIVAIAIAGIAMFLYRAYSGSVYKFMYLSIIEDSFTVNLTVLGVATLYVTILNQPSTPVIYTSIGIAFVEFWAIVIFHVCSRIKSIYVTYKRRHADNVDNTDQEMRVVSDVRVLHNEMNYREPLLDSSIQENT